MIKESDDMSKKPYEIIANVDGTLTLHVGGVNKKFHDVKALESFAMHLCEQVQDRWVGVFRLQDTADGRLDLIFNDNGDTIHIKNYQQAEKFAYMIMDDIDIMQEKQQSDE